jgi:hypothetical protein
MTHRLVLLADVEFAEFGTATTIFNPGASVAGAVIVPKFAFGKVPI